jgi:hypothetical protein
MDEEVLQVLEEINARGRQLLAAYEDTDAEELVKILPDLLALRQAQERVIAVLGSMKSSSFDR